MQSLRSLLRPAVQEPKPQVKGASPNVRQQRDLGCRLGIAFHSEQVSVLVLGACPEPWGIIWALG